MKLDVEKLTYVAEWLEAGAPHKDGGMAFYMDVWYGEVEEGEVFWEPWISNCGSVACIGGSLEQFFGVDYHKEPEKLGLTKAQVNDLFYPWDSGNYQNGSKHLSPENCAEVIYHLIETGEVDWSII